MNWGPPYSNRRARKRYDCDGRGIDTCTRTIKPGEPYQRGAYPPGGELGNNYWLHPRLCAPCASYYGHPIDEGATS